MRLQLVRTHLLPFAWLACLSLWAKTSASDPEPTPATTSAITSPLVIRASSEVSGYHDSNHVDVLTPSVSGSVENPVAGWSVKGHYLVDIVSAASVDIVSTASRRWSEVRHAAAVEGAYKPGTFGVNLSGSFSSEPDYLSIAGGGSVSQELYEKNLTLLLGYGHTHDTIGRSGTPFSVFSRTLTRNTINPAVTIVVNRSTVMALSADAVYERGDSSKPYRYIPMFTHAVAETLPRGASIDLVNRLRLPERPLEQLPVERDRYALTARLLHRFDRSTLRVEERFYADTWGLKASTTDARNLFDLGERFVLWPHARFHVQRPVGFWHRGYEAIRSADGAQWSLPALRTGDRELGPLWSVTGGFGVRWLIGPAERLSAWALGMQADLTWTNYLDDLYINQRVSEFVALVVEAEL